MNRWRFRLTDALFHAFEREDERDKCRTHLSVARANLAAVFVGQIDRDRETSGIPTLFH